MRTVAALMSTFSPCPALVLRFPGEFVVPCGPFSEDQGYEVQLGPRYRRHVSGPEAGPAVTVHLAWPAGSSKQTSAPGAGSGQGLFPALESILEFWTLRADRCGGSGGTLAP